MMSGSQLFAPPALVGAPIPVSTEQLLRGAEIWEQYQEWARFKRSNRDTVEATYTVESRPALPAGRNVPVAVEDDEFAPF